MPTVNDPSYDIFVPQKVPLLKIFDDVIASDLWFGPPNQSKILATPINWSLRLCPWSLASSIPVLGLERVCPQKGCPWPWPRIFLWPWPRSFLWPWPWPRALCPRLHLWIKFVA